MRPPVFPLLIVLVVGLEFPSQAVAAVQLPDGFVDEPVVTGLNQPIAMQRLPDGRILVAEQRTGAIRVVFPDSGTVSPPLFAVPDLNISGGERGLLGMAIDPGWPIRKYVYLMYTRTGDRIRLVRYNVWGDVADPASDLLQFVQPLYLFDDLPDSASTHNAGRLRFGPDGCLYASLGDDQDPCAAADSTIMQGQLLRLEIRNLPPGGEGQTVPPGDLVPAGNPFPNDGPNAALTFAYGLRNPWSFWIDPELDIVYLADVGEVNNEEINEVRAGDFLGWPWREGFRVMVRQECPESGFEGANDYKGPIIEVPHAPAQMAIVMGLMYRSQIGGTANWPAEYQGLYGSLFYAEYYSGWLRRARRLAGVWSPAAPVAGQPNDTDWGSGFVTAVDFMQDHDGSVLWLAQFDDTFAPTTGHIDRIRIVPTTGIGPGAARPRVLAAAPNPFRGETDLSFTLGVEEDVRLELFDLFGRRVRTLLSGRATPGMHRRAWDGRDEAGRRAPAGVYLARLAHGGSVETLRVLRLR